MIDFDIKAATKGELLYKIAALQLALDCTRNEDKAEYIAGLIVALRWELKTRRA